MLLAVDASIHIYVGNVSKPTQQAGPVERIIYTCCCSILTTAALAAAILPS